jgi:MFS family permease
MLAAFAYPIWIFFARTTDRLGKGLRTAARDALLSDNATPQTKARVFGFHRSMDTLGAAIGPVLALLLLILFPKNYSLLFLIAGIPGLISVALIFLLKEEKKPSSTLGKGTFFSFFKYWKVASLQYKKLVTGLLLLALFNSSDIFLLLKIKEATGDDRLAVGAYILYNMVFAIAAYPLGVLADKIGIKKVFLAGLSLFAVVYFLFGIGNTTAVFFIAFFIYGLYAAATEGITKAWISNLSHGANTATAIGFYTSCESICTLLASILAGLLWGSFGSSVTFFVTGGVALVVLLYFFIFYRYKGIDSSTISI